MLSLILLGVIIALWVIGGQKGGRIRDIGCPIVLGIALVCELQGDLMNRIIAGIATIALAQIIRLGYGNYDPENDDKPSFLASILKDRQGAIIRLVWGLLVGIVTPLFLSFTHSIILPAHIAYIICNVAVNYSVSKFRFPVILTDICVAAAFGSLVFYIR